MYITHVPLALFVAFFFWLNQSLTTESSNNMLSLHMHTQAAHMCLKAHAHMLHFVTVTLRSLIVLEDIQRALGDVSVRESE